MTGTEYKNAIMSALSEANQTADPISIIRTVLGNCDTDFPYGDCRGVLAALSKNDFMGWRACSYEEAKKFANEGVPTVGINDERIVIIVPDDYTLSSDKSDAKSKFVVSANSITNEEESSMKFFASSGSVFALPSSYGTVEDNPESMSSNGFGGFYVPISGNKKGVTNKVPRFVQMSSGPCVGYTIMMGYYYMLNRNNTAASITATNATNWFNDNLSEFLDGNYATGTAMNKVTKMEYSLSTLKSQLNLGKPVAITGKDSNGTLHMALAVAYIGNGGCTAQYVVIDPLYKLKGATTPIDFPTTLLSFKSTFSANASNWLTNSSGIYLSNPMCTFNDV